MIIERLIHALISSGNAAADELLLEALRLGNEPEQANAMAALMRRGTTRGLSGIVGSYRELPESLQAEVLQEIRRFHHALRESGRSDDPGLRIAACSLIALGRQGKLAYVLSDNLQSATEEVSAAAIDAMASLARWIATQTRELHAGQSESATAAIEDSSRDDGTLNGNAAEGADLAARFAELTDNRPDVEAAVARAIDLHRGKHGQELLRAALVLCDWPGSKTLGILSGKSKHGGQSLMVRKLQQPPASEHVEAFLLGASHGQLRSHFGQVFSRIEEAPVLDELLRKTHWLKDHQLQLCVHQVSRGAWWGEAELARDVERRHPDDAALIGEWIAASGMHDVIQDQRLDKLRQHAAAQAGPPQQSNDGAAPSDSTFNARLRLLRIAMARRGGGGASATLIQSFLADRDERLVRMAARELIRRRPPNFENHLLQLMTSAAESVRKVVSRSIGHVGFEHFWNRFEKMDRPTRRQAGRAMLKLSPDAAQRLGRKLTGGPVEQCVKAMQIAHELSLADALRDSIVPLCTHPNARVRSKAVGLIGQLSEHASDVLLQTVLQDGDARVRANAVEVLENRKGGAAPFVPLLTDRAKTGPNRERANAIKALHGMRVSHAVSALSQMLRDERGEHRISALWALRQIGFWQMLNIVVDMAKGDPNLRVRRYALGVLKGVAAMVDEQRKQQQQQLASAAAIAPGPQQPANPAGGDEWRVSA